MDTKPDRPDDIPTNGESSDAPRGMFGRVVRSLIPENSPIPKLSADAWKTVIIRVISKLPPWGLVLVIWTAIVAAFAWLIIRELNP